MADPEAPEGAGEEDPSPGGVSTFDTETEPEEPDQPAEPEPGEPEGETGGWDRSRWTLVAIVGSVVVGLATILVARSILQGTGLEIGIGETVGVGLIAFVVALAGFIPLRWGMWVVPFVALAHYGLNFYNMLFTDQSIYGFVEGSAMGYAVLTPVIGVALGYVIQGVYLVIAPE